jgi:hypothetical protein
MMVGLLVLQALPLWARTLEVGAGKYFDRIEDAYAEAREGDTIFVYPRQNNETYEQVAVLVRKKGLTFRAVPSKREQWIRISGKGFDYTGLEKTPRAIFQFDKEADQCVLEGFELFDAHNRSGNGAGVRINQANHVIIRSCNIHHNDMGIMSNGAGSPSAAVGQKIEQCIVHENDSPTNGGYHHNLYLGGTSVMLSFCEVYSTMSGHNVKSRAHFTWVQYCYIHHSANRELDLVDGTDTKRSGSDAVLMGNIIVKDPACKGNRGVILFGQDGGREHTGTIHLIHNTIVTFFPSPVLVLSSRNAKAHLVGNFVWDGDIKQRNKKILAVRASANLKNVSGRYNLFTGAFTGLGGAHLSLKDNLIWRWVESPFIDPCRHDYRPAKPLPTALPVKALKLPAFPGAVATEPDGLLTWQYCHPASGQERPAEAKLTVGAHWRPPTNK